MFARISSQITSLSPSERVAIPYDGKNMKPSAGFVTIAPMVAIIWLIVVFARHPWHVWRVAGLVLMIFGFSLLTAARINLGNSFSIRPQATALVTSGIYSRIRNPIYVFSAIGIVGAVLYIDRPILLFLLLPIILMQVVRARAESRVLEERFGDAYRSYRAGTWF